MRRPSSKHMYYRVLISGARYAAFSFQEDAVEYAAKLSLEYPHEAVEVVDKYNGEDVARFYGGHHEGLPANTHVVLRREPPAGLYRGIDGQTYRVITVDAPTAKTMVRTPKAETP